jgi:kelch-like protein 1/4/5
MQTWSRVVPMPAERDDAGACMLGSDIYIFGGNDDNETMTSTTYRFNTETYEWAMLAPMHEASSVHSVLVLDGLIYVMGGWDSNANGNSMSSVRRFDPVANSWSTVAPMLVARMSLRSFVLGGSIHAVGSFDDEGKVLSSMERYSVASDSWSEILGGDLGQTRSYCGALVVRMEMDRFDSLIAKAKNEEL